MADVCVHFISCGFRCVDTAWAVGICFPPCRYDPKENKWTRVASMSTRRLGVAVAVLGGFLYAVGGSDGTSPLNTGQSLNSSMSSKCNTFSWGKY
jgi:hypothetical protein